MMHSKTSRQICEGRRKFQTTAVFKKFQKQDTPVRLLRPNLSVAKSEGFGKIDTVGWFLLLFPVAAIGLGTWQVKRKFWKMELIKTLSSRVNSVPQALPDDLSELSEMEYYPVQVRGEFIHSKELYMGPRSLLQGGGAASESGVMSLAPSQNIGFLVVTPFRLADRDLTILVNRGWVPKEAKNPRFRQGGQIEGQVDLVGLVRLQENRPPLGPKDLSHTFTYRDVNKMCEITGAAPVFLDATLDSSVPGGPIGGQTKVFLRDEHLSYIFTWYSLAVATSIMWYRTFGRALKHR